MTNLEIGLWSFPILVGLILLRIPVGLAMLLVGFGGNMIITGSPAMMLAQFKHLPFGTFSSYSLSIVPLFLLMGQFATLGGMSAGLFRAAESFLGHRRGGIAMAVIGACAGFGAVCGSSLATAATMGRIALPELRRAGYGDALASGTLAAGGTLGILIPPSVALVIYALLTEQNIARLFVAAMLPGILAALGYMAVIAVHVRLFPGSEEARPCCDRAERLRAFLSIWPVLAIFLVVMGGIYLGIFTPTEAAAIGAAGTGLAALANGGLTRTGLVEAILSTASATGMIFLILLGAAVYNGFLALTQLPQEAAQFVAGSGFQPGWVLLLVLVFYVALGCVMDSLSMILLTVPILFPVMSGLDFGMSPDEFAIWFGILVLIAVEVGLVTPPVGMNLFIIQSMAPTIPMARIFRGILPFLVSDVLRLTLLVLFPALTLIGARLVP